MSFFPFMIQLEQKNCLIVGGGNVACRKAGQMYSFGANVTVVAKKICEPLWQFYEEEKSSGRLVLEHREAQVGDLDHADVVIMATNDKELNSKYAQICRERKILVNVVDVKEDCGFYFPAVIKQDEIVIAVSTGGSSPLLASKIKKEIESTLRTDYGKIARKMMEERNAVIDQVGTERERREVFEQKLNEELKRNVIRIGTRGSRLALIQTNMVAEALKKKLSEQGENYEIEIVVIKTQGDKKTEQPIRSFGGKAVFVEEFEQALSEGTIDLAVHSAKDMPNPCRKGLCIAGTLPRACPQDVLIYRRTSVFCKEDEFVIGTGSLRRQYQIQKLFPKAKCKSLRGNIGTRIDKLRDGQYDAILLAAAGIERQRLDKEKDLYYEYLPTEQMLPAAGQGIIAIETREDGPVKEFVRQISDKPTEQILTIERAVLTKLDAGCHEPIGVFAKLHENQLTLHLMKASESGLVRNCVQGDLAEWETLVECLVEEKTDI